MRARFVRFCRVLGRFLGTVIVGVLQGIAALIGDVHRQLHREFGQRVWAFYVVGALVVYLYATGGLGHFVAQLFMVVFTVVEKLAVLGVILFGLWIMFRGAFGRR